MSSTQSAKITLARVKFSEFIALFRPYLPGKLYDDALRRSASAFEYVLESAIFGGRLFVSPRMNRAVFAGKFGTSILRESGLLDDFLALQFPAVADCVAAFFYGSRPVFSCALVSLEKAIAAVNDSSSASDDDDDGE